MTRLSVTTLLCAVLASASVCATDAPIRLGRVAVLSGPLAHYGAAKTSGSDLVYDEVNRMGGVAGRKLEIVTKDDQYDPKNAAELTSLLIKDPAVVGLVGFFGVPSVEAVTELVQREKVALIGPTSGTQALREPFKRYIFPIRASYLTEASRSVAHLRGVGVDRLAVVYQSNAFGELGKTAFLDALAAASVTAAAVVSIDPSGKDAEVASKQLAQKPVQAILFAGFPKAAAAFITAARKTSNSGAAFYCLSGVDTTELLAALGDAAHGVIVSQVVPVPTIPTLPVVRDYLEASRKVEHSPSFYGLQGYIEARVVVEALRRSRGGITRESLVVALESLNDLDVGGVRVRFDPRSREGSPFVDLTVVGGSGRLRR